MRLLTHKLLSSAHGSQVFLVYRRTLVQGRSMNGQVWYSSLRQSALALSPFPLRCMKKEVRGNCTAAPPRKRDMIHARGCVSERSRG